MIATSILLLHLLGMLAAMHALMHTRTPQGTIGWVLGLLLLPYLTLLPYLYLGSSRFRGYTAKQKKPTPASAHAAPAGCGRFAAISAMQGRPFRGGHQWRLLIGG
ncbi:MAG: PLDc N-terminal domain-containing protein, partial [Rhodanobacter sp.]